MYAAVAAAAICGIYAKKVLVEADVSDGLPLFNMVGYLSSEVREAADRVRTAMKNCGFYLPPKRITVSLSPADLRKEGSGFDLPIAVAILIAMGYIPAEAADGILFAGELGLSGDLEGIRGILEITAKASLFGAHTVIVPLANLAEGSVIRTVKVLGAGNLLEVVEYLTGQFHLQTETVDPEEIRRQQENEKQPDFSDLRGQASLRRAAEIAVCGMHNLLIIGPPGTGKTMTARRIASILPRMSLEEALEVSRIHSIAGILPEDQPLMMIRPFRSPHHTITSAALAGGGFHPRPGEVSLAHRGVLHLDEFPEFAPGVLEILRQPLEDGKVYISRNSGTFVFPADFMLVASMNPCKCGYYPDRRRCRCSEKDVRRYLGRISQPLLDRIDICAEAESVSYEELSGSANGESSASIRARIEKAQKRQSERYAGTRFRFNSDLSGDAVAKYCDLGKKEEQLMKLAFDRMNLTGRSYSRILKVARSIADLDGEDSIRERHLQEALRFRTPDRKYWGGEYGE